MTRKNSFFEIWTGFVDEWNHPQFSICKCIIKNNHVGRNKPPIYWIRKESLSFNVQYNMHTWCYGLHLQNLHTRDFMFILQNMLKIMGNCSNHTLNLDNMSFRNTVFSTIWCCIRCIDCKECRLENFFTCSYL